MHKTCSPLFKSWVSPSGYKESVVSYTWELDLETRVSLACSLISCFLALMFIRFSGRTQFLSQWLFLSRTSFPHSFFFQFSSNFQPLSFHGTHKLITKIMWHTKEYYIFYQVDKKCIILIPSPWTAIVLAVVFFFFFLIV